jgi:hypothetical protein
VPPNQRKRCGPRSRRRPDDRPNHRWRPLQGTTQASFVITGISGTVASFEGTIVFAVNNGTLTAHVAGTWDIATGQFQATTSSISGTDKLAGATGSLSFSGVEDLSTGAFTESVTGEICANLSP